MSTMEIATVELVRAGCDPVEVLVDQLTPTAVGNLFGLDPLTIWLKEEFGQKAFFPNSANTSFAFSPDVGDTIKSLVVEGMGTRSVRCQSPLVMNPTNSSSSTPAIGRSARASSSSIASDCTPFFRSLKQPSVINVKVFQAKVSKSSTGKLLFDKVGQAFIDVTESTANVLYITSVVQRKWGKGYKLVTGDGLTIDDSSGTQGLRFWKTTSRKIFAVESKVMSQLLGGSKGKQRAISDSDSADDLPPRKLSKLNAVLAAVESLHKEVINMKFPGPQLYLAMCESLKCNICLAIITPPVTYAPCCMRILGCEACVTRSYNEDQRCPLCRATVSATNITSSRVLGLNEVLHQLQAASAVSTQGGTSTQPAVAVAAQPAAPSHPYAYHVPTPPTPAADSDDDFM